MTNRDKMVQNNQLRVNLQDCWDELRTGSFFPMSQTDKETFADAEEHTLIGEIKRGNHTYIVLFDCVACEFEINWWDNGHEVWVIDSVTGEVREL